MPIYEYRCDVCEKIKELRVTSWKNAEKTAPCVCGGTLTKIFSRGAFAILDHVGDSVKMGS